ncbi:hypothetical protein HOD05_00600 [Candidatus Woesearchaeota archaeon]|nr:hypothetical protein [Candidatus Woesearchaeota archaeon]MBT4150907.1 hypothetical protein [Candidatus Woesearchaeota archaeon]MBT4247549.1 hypothetical protein [Candidatus Woesearchaeota archaeon]MBT4433697.1 hypothetical protein [Candidatus Woesearchaeota archaeon]MBT7332092.1 hypothetical protein [Candidatus Woesearchaeota archaeon]
MGRIINIRDLELRYHQNTYVIPDDVDQVILIHGTSGKFLDDIMKNGLKPRKLTGNDSWGHWGCDLISNSDLIYFGNLATARHAARNCAGKFGIPLVYIQVVLDVADLVPDEDWEDYGAKDWRESLAQGSCATSQPVTPDKFLNVLNTLTGEYLVRTQDVTFF